MTKLRGIVRVTVVRVPARIRNLSLLQSVQISPGDNQSAWQWVTGALSSGRGAKTTWLEMGETACPFLHIISSVGWENFTFTCTMKFHTTIISYVFTVCKCFICNSLYFSKCTFLYLVIHAFWKMNYTPAQSRSYSMTLGISILLSFLLRVHLQATNREPQYPFTSVPNSIISQITLSTVIQTAETSNF